MQGISERGDELDVFTDQTAEHLFDTRDHPVDADRPGVHHLLAAEREQLTRESGGALGGIADFLYILPSWISRLDVAEQQRAVAHDDGEEIVEIVGYAAGELTDGVHLSRLRQLLLELPLLGEIAHGINAYARREPGGLYVEHSGGGSAGQGIR